MSYYKIDMQGKFYMNRGSLPVWEAADEGRLFWDRSTDELYYANASEWVAISTEENPGPAVYS